MKRPWWQYALAAVAALLALWLLAGILSFRPPGQSSSGRSGRHSRWPVRLTRKRMQ